MLPGSRSAFPIWPAAGLALIYLRATPGRPCGYLFICWPSVWGTDIGAYIAGRLIGGPKLAPAISPNKTWAGFVGGMVLRRCVGARMPCACARFGTPLVAMCCWRCSVGGRTGRRSIQILVQAPRGVKESGNLIPGHGGVLDRIDGLIFAAVLLPSSGAARRCMVW